jgi:hypothetical protein
LGRRGSEVTKRQAPRRSFSEPILSNDRQTTIDGRKYQTLSNKYCLPVDEIEQDRLTNTVCFKFIEKKNLVFLFFFLK